MLEDTVREAISKEGTFELRQEEQVCRERGRK